MLIAHLIHNSATCDPHPCLAVACWTKILWTLRYYQIKFTVLTGYCMTLNKSTLNKNILNKIILNKSTLTLIKKPLTLIKKCSPLSSGWVSGCHPAAGPALPFSRSEDFSALWVRMFSFWSFPRWISWRWDFSVLWVQEKCFESFVILIIFQMDQLPFSRSEDFSALWVLEKSENVLSLLTSVRVLEKSVVILIISQIDRVKLRVREICHCCFKRVFNWWYLKRITHLFTVVFLMLVFSDVLKLLVFWPTPGSRCERREPSRQLFRSSLYNSCKRKALIILYFSARKKTTWLYVHLGFGLLNILCVADGLRKKGWNTFPDATFWWNISQKFWWNISQNICLNFSFLLV